jgi:hypothetical protein
LQSRELGLGGAALCSLGRCVSRGAGGGSLSSRCGRRNEGDIERIVLPGTCDRAGSDDARKKRAIAAKAKRDMGVLLVTACNVAGNQIILVRDAKVILQANPSAPEH